MQKEKAPPPELRVRDPMSVMVEKLGDKSARVYGDLSKETLRELLMSSLMIVPKAPTTISTSFLDMLDRKKDIDLWQQYGARDKKQKKLEKAKLLRKERKAKKKRTRTRMKMWDDVPWGRGGKWDFYGEASTDEEIKKEIEEEEEEAEEETLPSCPSTPTEELNLSYDGKWLRSNMRFPLRMAFKEIVAKKPYDPVGYLGFWLLNYKKCEEDRKRRSELDEELSRLRYLIMQTIPEEKIVEEQEVQVEEGEEESNVKVDWNFQFYDNNQL